MLNGTHGRAFTTRFAGGHTGTPNAQHPTSNAQVKSSHLDVEDPAPCREADLVHGLGVGCWLLDVCHVLAFSPSVFLS